MVDINKIDDDNKLYQKYLNKKINAKKEGLVCELTYYEYVTLVDNAGLKSSDLGFTGRGYVLARYNDSGNYTFDNCRFITHKENIKERKTSEKVRLASSNNIRKYNMNTSKEERRRNFLNSEYYKHLKEESRKKQELRNMAKNQSYVGEHNSQFGTFWITNGITNKKWKADKGELPEGYYKGRVM